MNQSLPAREVIVVDDGSTDHTATVVSELAAGNDRVQLIRQPNGGAHSALQRAREAASGEYFAILNSDDEYVPEWLEWALGLARSRNAPLVAGGVEMIDAQGAALTTDHPSKAWYSEACRALREGESVDQALRRHNSVVTTSNMLIHRELWDALEGFQDFRYAHDLNFLLRALAIDEGMVVVEPEIVGVRYRVHDRNTIAEDVEAALTERERVLSDVPAAGLLRSIRRWGLRLKGLTGSHLREGQRRSLPGGAIRFSGDGMQIGVAAPSLDAGGLEEVVDLLSDGLARRGHRLSVMLLQSSGRVAERLGRRGIDVVVGSKPSEWSEWARSKKVEVISAHHVPVEFAEWATRSDIPVVETLHNVFAWFDEARWADEARKDDLGVTWTAVSAEVAEYACQGFGRRLSTTVIPNAVQPERIPSMPRPFARRCLGVPPDILLLIQVGRISHVKNQEAAIAGLRRVLSTGEEAVLVLAGSEPGDYATTLRQRHRDLLDSGALRMRGEVDPSLLYSAADLYLSGSLFEGWSVAASEAAWHGIPLVLSETGGSRGLVGEESSRGVLARHPLGDPMRVSPENISEPIESSSFVEAVALAAQRVSSGAFGGKHHRDQIRGWARSALDPDRFISDYESVLKAARERGGK